MHGNASKGNTGKQVNRVPIFFAALITVGMGGYLFTWSYFRNSLGQLFPDWSQSQLSLPFGVHNVTVVVIILVTGQLLRKFSGRTVIAFGATALLIGFGLFPFLPVERPAFAAVLATVFFGLIAACSVGIGVVAGFDVYQPWFPDRVGLISGLWTLWGGASPILLGALCGAFISVFGVRTAIGLIGVLLAAIVFLSLVYAKKPGPDTVLPAPKHRRDDAAFVDCTTKEMLRTSAFWHLFLFNLMIRCAGLVISDLGGTMASDMGAATLAGLLFAPANGVSSVIGGYLADRIKLSKVIFSYTVVQTAGGVALLFGNATSNVALVLLGVTLVGFAYGGSTVGSTTAVRFMFGSSCYAQNIGLILASSAPASLAVLAAGRFLARDGGDYTSVFWMILIFSVVALADAIVVLATRSFAHIADVKRRSAK
jgi:OFA family oxalate/formate antiporter-like MFS transporter